MDYPLVFFHEDRSGGWTRLQNILRNNDLHVHGARVPPNHGNVLGLLQEEVVKCQLLGANGVEVPPSSIPYRVLIQTLREGGLV